jgi:phospholipid transport system substrate-binding protein
MTSRSLILSTLALVAWSSAAAAATSAGTASAIVQDAIDRVLAVLRDPSLHEQRAERHRQLRAIASEVFDWQEMAQRSLGPPWRTLTPKERDRFTAAFQDLLAAEYMNDIDRLQGTETIAVVGEKPLGDDRRVDTIVSTKSNERLRMSYFLEPKNGTWRVYDVGVEDLSLVKHYRDTFQRLLTNMSFTALLEKLERRRESIAPAPR